MCEELIKSLRLCRKILHEDDSCIEFVDGSCEAFPICAYQLMEKAADVIEELQKEYESISASLIDSVELVRKLQKPVEDRVKEYLKTKGFCPTCKRSSDVLNDGTTACPIEKCYVLPLDGFCHLYEPKEAEEVKDGKPE